MRSTGVSAGCAHTNGGAEQGHGTLAQLATPMASGSPYAKPYEIGHEALGHLSAVDPSSRFVPRIPTIPQGTESVGRASRVGSDVGGMEETGRYGERAIRWEECWQKGGRLASSKRAPHVMIGTGEKGTTRDAGLVSLICHTGDGERLRKAQGHRTGHWSNARVDLYAGSGWRGSCRFCQFRGHLVANPTNRRSHAL